MKKRFAIALLIGSAWTPAKGAPPKEAETPFTEKTYGGKIVSIQVQPTELELNDPLSPRRLLVTGKTAEGEVDLGRVAQFSFPKELLSRSKDGFFTPVKGGKGEISVTVAGHKLAVPVVVGPVEKSRPISFVRDVMPILSKMECNSGPCHGTPKGKNGFKLSLRGYDPEWDHDQLVDDLSSRRFNRSRPRDSLMLLKPSQQVPHEGGLRFGVDSREYQIFLDWVLQGNQSDVGKASRATSISVFPSTIALREPGAAQDLLVIAKYADGSTRDVTRDTVISSSVEYVVKIGPSARLQALRRGESAILFRYEGNYAVRYATVLSDRSGFVWTEPVSHNYIDELVHKKLRAMKILPSELAHDEDFLRRIHLDVIGVPPTTDEVRAFLADKSPTRQKRDRVIDQLFERPEYVDRWSHKWADLLQCNRKYLGERGVWGFRNWIRQSVAHNKPMDQFVRELLTASGSSIENPAANFYRVARDPLAAMENTTHLFLGVRFNCNKCHDHPFERWTQSQHYELGAYFAQVGRKPGAGPDEEVVYDRRDAGEPVKHPRTGATIPARFPYSHAADPDGSASLRQQLADWLTAKENPYFARSIANRFWSYYLGAGIIDPVDDVRSSNPPSNPELLDALTKDFVDGGFDLKRLMKTIAKSATYQRSLTTNEWNEDDRTNFSHALPRRLTAEQLQDAISVATGVTVRYPGLPEGFRATQLPDSKIEMDFLDQFGRPPRESVCECERVAEVSLKQALNLINGPTIGDALADGNSRFAKLVASKASDQKLVEEVYLAVLCRYPQPKELADGIKYLAGAGTKLEGTQDLAWALCNTPAFLFNR